jgi:hypothetical protein
MNTISGGIPGGGEVAEFDEGATENSKIRPSFEQIQVQRGARWYQLRLGGYPRGGVGVVGFEEGVGVPEKRVTA